MQIAWFTPDGIFVRSHDGAVRKIDSAFEQGVRRRHQSMQRRDGWKGSSREGPFASGQMLWGVSAQDPTQLRIATTSITAFPASGQLLYSIDADGLDAVCAVSLDDFSERRLMHGSERRVRHLAASPDGSRIACSVGHRDGTSNIAVMKADASDSSEVTEGHSIDLAPSWVPGHADVLVFQSAGIGRDRAGMPVGLAPFTIQRLELARGEMETLLESPAHDFLVPKMDASGTLYAIRRPAAAARRVSPWRVLLDIALMPFRIAWALFQYLNFFTARYTGKPLTTAGGPKREGPDMRQLVIHGNLIDAAEAAREAGRDASGRPPLVPRSWELVTRASDGKLTTLARNVVSFDIAADGAVVYCTGSVIFEKTPDGESRRLLDAEHIEQVVVLG